MDRPCLGTSTDKDRHYTEWMSLEPLIAGLRSLNSRGIRFAMSYGGTCGAEVCILPLPDDLGLSRLYLHAGRSSRATLNDGTGETVESLYLAEVFARLAVKMVRLPIRAAERAELRM